MAIPGVTREYPPGSCRNSRNPMSLTPRHEMRPDSLVLGAEQFRVPNQTRQELQFIAGTLESPLEHLHTSRRTLMSPQECEIARCSPNQLGIMSDSSALSPEQSPVPHHTGQFLAFLLATPEIPLDTRLKSIGTPISAHELEECSIHPISS